MMARRLTILFVINVVLFPAAAETKDNKDAGLLANRGVLNGPMRGPGHKKTSRKMKDLGAASITTDIPGKMRDYLK